MADPVANVVVSMPSQLFTRPEVFSAVSNGKIFIGQPDTDPTVVGNQIQVYIEGESGDLTPVSQPLRTNTGGYPVYNGQIVKFVTVQNYSMTVQSTIGVQLFYFPDLLKYSPDQLEQRLASAADGSGDALIAVKQPFDNSVAMTQHDKNTQLVNVKDFGAKGDYVIGGTGTDDTAAIQKAMLYCSGSARRALYYGDGCFLVTGTITSKPVMMFGNPGTTTIVFKNMSGLAGFDFTSATEPGRTLGADGIEFVAEGANILCAIQGPKDSANYLTNFLKYQFTRNYCRGANRVVDTYAFGWDFGATKWIRVGDSNVVEIYDNNFQGVFNIKADPTGQFLDSAIELDANAAVLGALIRHNNIGPMYTGINILNRVFTKIHHNDIAGVMDGIAWNGTTLFNEPKVSHNNINAQRYGVVADGPGALSFTDNTIRRHRSGWKGATWNWYGYRLANVQDLKLVHNTAQADFSDGAFPGTHYGYNLLSCGMASVDGNFVGVNCDQGITLSDCSGVNVNNTSTAQNRSTDVLFRMTANTRRSTIGQYALVSSFLGTVLSKDSTVVDALPMLNREFDLQSTGSVTLDMTRINAATDFKKWRTSVSTTTGTRQILSDAGTGTNYEVVTRDGTSVTQIEWRAGRFRLNNGPDIITGSGSPEGVVTSVKGSLFLRTDSGASSSLYVKESGTGNTGWSAK